MNFETQKKFAQLKVELKNGILAEIRPLALSDGDRLANFYAQISQVDKRFYCPHPLNSEYARKNVAESLNPYEVVLVLILPDNEIGGYAWYRWKKSDDAESIFGICLRPDWQGAGGGRALMSRLDSIAAHIGPVYMTLTVQKANVRGLALYQKMGFNIIREQMRPLDPVFGFLPEPEYFMKRQVRV